MGQNQSVGNNTFDRMRGCKSKASEDSAERGELLMFSVLCSMNNNGCDSFLACENFGRMSDHSFSACAFFFSFFFCEVEISSRTPIPLFMPGSVHSGSASCGDCDRIFPNKLRVSSFPNRFLHCALTTA